MISTKDVSPICWAILLICAAIIYCLFLIIVKPFNYDWGIANIGIIFGTFDLIYLLFIFIDGIYHRDAKIKEMEKRKHWIEKVLEKSI
jgi:uncharacterized membrane protein